MRPNPFNRDGYYYVRNRDEMPKEPHYAVIEFDSITIPGDERSRTCPGHGYPEHSEDTAKYIVFENKEVWECYVKHNRHGRPNMVALYVKPATIETHVTVSIKP